MSGTAHILDRIVESKKKEILQSKECASVDHLQSAIDPNRKHRSLINSLKTSSDAFGIIAEIKKKSPSKGVISHDFNPQAIAKQYEAAGASAISVLTDEFYFGGCAQDLKSVREVVDLPILRKDFIIDQYQLFEAAAWGADVVLLIARILDESSIRLLAKKAEQLGLEVLFEIHDMDDLRKLQYVGPCVLGINNRNLQSFEVSLNVTEALMKYAPKDTLVISESGVTSAEDILFVKRCGAIGALIGEHFMRSASPGDALKHLLQLYRKSLK